MSATRCINNAWEWYRSSFLFHFLTYLLLPALLLLLLAMIGNRIGVEHGVDKLIWHDDPLRQFFVGASMMILINSIVYVSYLLWLRDLRIGGVSGKMLTGNVIRKARTREEIRNLQPIWYWSYFWRATFCFLGTLLVLMVITVGLEELLPGYEPASMPSQQKGDPNDPSAYVPPWPFLLVSFVSGLLVWLLHHVKVPGRWAHKRGLLEAVLGLLLVALGAAVSVFLGTWLNEKVYPSIQDEVTATDASWQAPHPHWLILGLWTGMAAMWFLGYLISVCQRDEDGLFPVNRLRRLGKAIQRAQYRRKQGLFCTQNVLQALSALAFLAVWGALLRVSWVNHRDEKWWTPILVGVGAVLTFLPMRSTFSPRHRRHPGLFVTALLANGIVCFIAVTYVTSGPAQVTGLQRLLLGLTLPLGLLLVLASLICLAPRAGRRFLLWARKITHGRRKLSPQESMHRERALWALAAGWLYFVLICSCTYRLSSPAVIVFAMLYGLVAFYGTITYVVRRSLPLILSTCALLAFFSGINHYKFRFGGPLDRYEAPGEGVPQDKVPVYLATTIEDDLARLKQPIGNRLRTPEQVVTQYLNERSEIVDRVIRDRWQLDAFRRLLDAAQQGKIELTPEEKKKYGMEIKELRLKLREKETEVQGELARLLTPEVRQAASLLKQNRILTSVAHSRLVGQQPDVFADENDLLEIEQIPFLGKGDPDVLADPKPLIIVAVSGGGIRSAAWTHLVLSELEKAFACKQKDFPSHVRIITGASGGMLGAGYYLACLDNPEAQPRGGARQAELDEQFDKLTMDHLTPLMSQFVFGDVPNFFSPWPVAYDRGKALEDAWIRNLGPRFNVSFEDLRRRELQGWCPSIVFTPMMIEDGRRLIISNVNHTSALVNGGALIDPDAPTQNGANGDPIGVYSREAMELFRLFPGKKVREGFALSTAVRMSASFPYFSPAVSLPTVPRRRIVDAGYYDNYGVSFGANWLFSLRNVKWLNENASHVVVIQIRDWVTDEYRRMERVRRDRSTLISRTFEEISSPPEGLDSGRIASSSFRNDGQLELLWQRKATPIGGEPGFFVNYFRVVNFEYPGGAALTWYLSKKEIEDLKQRIRDDKIQDRIRGLVDFLFAEN